MAFFKLQMGSLCLCYSTGTVLAHVPSPSSSGKTHVEEISKEILLSLFKTSQAESMEEVRKVVRQTKQGENLHFCLKMHFRRLKKCAFWLMQTRPGCVLSLADMRECRCDCKFLFVLGAMAWKGTAHKHPSIFFQPTYCMIQACMFPCGSPNRQKL